MKRREFMTVLGGGAAAWPRGARSQQRLPVIGFLDGRAGTANSNVTNPLRSGLAEAGLVDGTHYMIDYLWGGTQTPRLRAAAQELVQREPAVIVADASLGPIRAAMLATATIPIVFFYGGDPVKDGLVTSLNRPGANVTGITALNGELAGKRLDLLHKLVPSAKTVGFLSGTPAYVSYVTQTSEMQAAGRALGLQIQIVECRDDRDYERAFAALMRGGAGALILGAFVLPNIVKVIPLAARYAIPTMYTQRPFAVAGGLISYGTDGRALDRLFASQYVARILKGEKPSDLPVQQPTKFELVINLQTARTLGIEVPPMLLGLTDEVIE
jgi:putative ABC transport system substrate-binding protein